MANFLDDLGAALKKAAEDVQNDVTIAAREQKLKEAYQKLGQLHFQAVSQDFVPSNPEIDEVIGRIRALQKEIAELRSKNRPAGG